MFKKILATVIISIATLSSAKAETSYSLYYFYNNVRCANCVAFETMTKKLAPTLPVNLKLVNIQDPGNEHFIKDYKLYTKSIVITDDKGNYKNLPKIWQFVRNDAKFNQYITEEVNQFIKDNK